MFRILRLLCTFYAKDCGASAYNHDHPPSHSTGQLNFPARSWATSPQWAASLCTPPSSFWAWTTRRCPRRRTLSQRSARWVVILRFRHPHPYPHSYPNPHSHPPFLSAVFVWLWRASVCKQACGVLIKYDFQFQAGNFRVALMCLLYLFTERNIAWTNCRIRIHEDGDKIACEV